MPAPEVPPESVLPAEARGREFRNVLRNTSYLTLAQLVTRVAGFVYVLALARFLPAAAFGHLNLVLTILLVADMVADLGLSRLILRELARAPARTRSVLARLVPLKLLLSGAVYGAIVAAALLCGAEAPLVHLLVLAGLSLLPSGLAMLAESALQAEQRFALVSLAHVGLSLGQAGLGLAALALGLGAPGTAAAFTVSYFAFLFVLARGLGPRRLPARPRIAGGVWLRWLGQALPFSVVGLVFALTMRADFLVLGLFASGEDLAVYGMAAKVTEAALLATIALGTALTPHFARHFAQARAELVALYLRALRFAFLLTVPAALAAMLLGPPLLGLVLQPSYDPAGPLVRLMFMSFPFWVGYFLNASLLLGGDRQHRSTLVLVALAVAQVATAFLLVPRFGPTGAAASFAVSGFVGWIGTTIYVESLLCVGAALRRAVAAPLAGCGAAFTAVAAAPEAGVWLLAPALALFAAPLAADPAWRRPVAPDARA